MLGQSWDPKDYAWKVGDRVVHVRDSSVAGTVEIVEDNGLSVMVQWDSDPPGELNFQWANKLRKASER